MATTTAFTMRMDSDLKRQFDAIANALGLSATAAFNVMAKKFVEDRGFPFSVRLPESFNPNQTTIEAMQYAQERADGKVPDDSPAFTNAADAMAYLNQKADRVSD
ncbi:MULTISPECIES: type II toxin-antitoxin system RelB/DinJ family antitoxin [unclassified Bifidobacterium]|uniref:type II toxin-antitoxin system RelB/DinJ family antitoxin n=1 Tax=unclassified Bifidobacterium TaxID=2608897 RepID=UPI0023F90611|nr:MULTISPECIES: type II toxin-antitoxin system RelB/DinJ family antitoxin [unclassified Bifidobacterium]WEV65846.1 type II toxin-antitoxin system RelB/DinJ family antitoxin [Bifidobacterium sp. ESL0764]WEV75367.1 type II toxin-antitoxin system RelB/DinJ family antitoxin [Bifidobacterium sp. ESL0800]